MCVFGCVVYNCSVFPTFECVCWQTNGDVFFNLLVFCLFAHFFFGCSLFAPWWPPYFLCQWKKENLDDENVCELFYSHSALCLTISLKEHKLAHANIWKSLKRDLEVHQRQFSEEGEYSSILLCKIVLTSGRSTWLNAHFTTGVYIKLHYLSPLMKFLIHPGLGKSKPS